MEAEFRAKFIRGSLDAALKAREYILKFTTFQIEQDEFVDGLSSLEAREAIYSNWELLQENQSLYPCLEIYQVIDSICEDLDAQLKFYGYASLKEDLKQIDFSIDILKRALGMEAFDKVKYHQFIKKQINGGM